MSIKSNSDIIDYKNGCWGIFAAKIITAEKTAKEFHRHWAKAPEEDDDREDL